MFFYNSAEKAIMEENECFSSLKILIGRQYSFQKLTQFSQGNKLPDACPPKFDGFLSRETRDSST
jgi:hypothetical protein